MTDQHPDEQLLLDLALAEVEGTQRDLLTSHLALCETCRAEYCAIADSVDHALAAAPRVAPPAGFSRSVLEAMGFSADEAQKPVTSDRPAPVQPHRAEGIGRGAGGGLGIVGPRGLVAARHGEPDEDRVRRQSRGVPGGEAGGRGGGGGALGLSGRRAAL